MPEITKTLYVTKREQWRRWLDENHADEKEIWLIFYKKHTCKPRIPYEEAVEEALCFGWIDSTVKRIDEDRYVQRFTPRHDDSIWSETNKRRVNKLIRQKLMTEAGRAKVRHAKKTGRWDEALPPNTVPPIPPDLRKALAAEPRARDNFRRFPPSHRKHYVWWVQEAKREGTRERRISEVVKRARQNKKLGVD